MINSDWRTVGPAALGLSLYIRRALGNCIKGDKATKIDAKRKSEPRQHHRRTHDLRFLRSQLIPHKTVWLPYPAGHILTGQWNGTIKITPGLIVKSLIGDHGGDAAAPNCKVLCLPSPANRAPSGDMVSDTGETYVDDKKSRGETRQVKVGGCSKASLTRSQSCPMKRKKHISATSYSMRVERLLREMPLYQVDSRSPSPIATRPLFGTFVKV